jgi:hypothetical protein
MKQSKIAKTIGCCFLLSLQLVTPDSVRAQENLRISRTTAPNTEQTRTTYGAPAQPRYEPAESDEISTSTSPSDANAESIPGALLKANTKLNSEDKPIPPYQKAIIEWQNKNLPTALENLDGATMGSANNRHHKGLTAHLGGALSVLGTVAGPYIPGASVIPKKGPSSEPRIRVQTGLCPAAFDPAFQVPVIWWEIVASEESKPRLGRQWKLWLSAVQNVFQAHAIELHDTPGVALLHVIVNPNGSIFNITPLRGSERTIVNLRQIILSVGSFPPFPEGSKAHCYHLVFDGSAGI